MARKLSHQISTTTTTTLFVVVIILHRPPAVIAETACPYPCYPTPTGVPTTKTPPMSPSTQTGSNYYPPPAFYNSPPSTGNLPYYPPPSGFGGYCGYGGYGPPPPDPILPYFPYYFKNGLHKDQASSSPSFSSSSSSLVGDQVLRRSCNFQILIMACVVIIVLNLPLH